jgi:uncharacterized protein
VSALARVAGRSFECSATDFVAMPTTRTVTPEGFLRARGTLARTGVQEYRARELGISDVPPDSVVRLYRGPEELFSPETMASFEGQTLTLRHPSGGRDVSSRNWRELAVGDYSGIARDGEMMAGNLCVRDERGVQSVTSRKTEQLSLGYKFRLDMTPGTTAGGEAYDGVMRNIRGNHAALVDQARGGPACRVGDQDGSRRGDKRMANKAIDGVDIDVDAQGAAIIDRAIREREEKLTATTAARDAANARVVQLEAEVAQLKVASDNMKRAHDAAVAAVPGEAKLDELVRGRSVLVRDALTVAPDLATDGKPALQIMREALVVAVRDEASGPVVAAAVGATDPMQASELQASVGFRVAVAQAAQRAGRDGDDRSGGRARGRDDDDRGERERDERSARDARYSRSLAGNGGGSGTGTEQRGRQPAVGEVFHADTDARGDYMGRMANAWRDGDRQQGGGAGSAK